MSQMSKMPPAENPYSLLAIPENTVDPAVAEAIMWMVNLKSGEATDSERSDFAEWYEADTAHARAWKHLSASLGPMNIAGTISLPKGALAHRVIKEEVNRRHVLKAATCGIALVTSTAVADQWIPLQTLLADFSTWTGKQREIALPDGGRMTLGPRAAANLQSDRTRDQIELLAGDLFITSGTSRNRYINIAMNDWFLTLPTGRASFHNHGAHISAVALNSKMTATIAGGAPIEIDARHSLLIENGTVVRRAANITREESWSSGLLVVDDDSLDNLIRYLRPYFVGLIRATPAANKLRIAGVFRLLDPRNTLLALSENFPIKVREVTPFWLSVDVT